MDEMHINIITLKPGKFGGEFDKCENCSDNGDNCNLYETEQNLFICETCLRKYDDAKETLHLFNQTYEITKRV